MLLSGSQVLTDQDLNFHTSDFESTSEFRQTLEQVERQYIEEVLLSEGGRVEAAAKRLGIPRSSLYQRIKEFGIARPGTTCNPQIAADRSPG